MNTKEIISKLNRTWTIVGFVLTVLSLLSLFGNLKEITFHLFIERLVLSYKALIYPLYDFLNIFEFSFPDGVKDVVTIVILLGNRTIGMFVNQFSANEKRIIKCQKKRKISREEAISKIKFSIRAWLLIIYFCSILSIFAYTQESTSDYFLVSLVVIGLFFVPAVLPLIEYLGLLLSKFELLLCKLLHSIWSKYKLLRRIVKIQNEIENSRISIIRYRERTIKILVINLSISIFVILLLGLNHYLLL